MRDGDFPFDTSGMTEIIFDDIKDISIHNGIFRCTLYAFRIVPPNHEAQWVPVLPIAIPISAVGPIAGKALAKAGDGSYQACKAFVRGAALRLVH